MKRHATSIVSASIFAVLLLFQMGLPPQLNAAGPVPGRFFLMGDGHLDIKNTRTGQKADVNLFSSNGNLDQKSLRRIDAVFGLSVAKEGFDISPRLLSMLDYFSDLAAPGRVIDLDSGYRSPGYNARLHNTGHNVARTSEHMDGLAADFHIKGVNGRRLWEIIKDKNCCGVGYYGGIDIHLDSGRPRFWEAATSKVGTRESEYNRKIHLSTNFDRYLKREKVRLILSAISNFPFGVNHTVELVDNRSARVVSTAAITTRRGSCIMIDNRKAAHHLAFRLPADLQPGRYRIRIIFCRRPFPLMPVSTLSNEIELWARPGKTSSH